uniref:Uncharacterized protein n=1 Tax=Pristionchus pacificus TaxID=54126 RepID=A0A2A6B6V5_PRIPA|eukprot:PDM61598.1 hypothetical protein PRIPAC_51040 [Pristionchus pacificus]
MKRRRLIFRALLGNNRATFYGTIIDGGLRMICVRGVVDDSSYYGYGKWINFLDERKVNLGITLGKPRKMTQGIEENCAKHKQLVLWTTLIDLASSAAYASRVNTSTTPATSEQPIWIELILV